MKRPQPKRTAALLLGLALGLGAAGAGAQTQVKVGKNPTSGMLTWSAKADGLSIQFIQLPPEFVRAVFAKHHLPAEQYNRIASYCDFGTIFRNTSGKTLRYDVRSWRAVSSKGVIGTVKPKSEWTEEWHKLGIHYTWSLFPDTGTFYAGDWQQGFTTIRLPHGSRFDLTLKWKIDGVEHTAKIENMQCATDVTRNP